MPRLELLRATTRREQMQVIHPNKKTAGLTEQRAAKSVMVVV
jgi:hypothetical protein